MASRNVLGLACRCSRQARWVENRWGNHRKRCQHRRQMETCNRIRQALLKERPPAAAGSCDGADCEDASSPPAAAVVSLALVAPAVAAALPASGSLPATDAASPCTEWKSSASPSASAKPSSVCGKEWEKAHATGHAAAEAGRKPPQNNRAHTALSSAQLHARPPPPPPAPPPAPTSVGASSFSSHSPLASTPRMRAHSASTPACAPSSNLKEGER